MISRKSNQTGSINTTERWISGIAGGALAFYAVKNLKNRRRRSWAGYSSAVGASLMLFRSVTGKSPLYRLIGINTQNRDLPESASVQHDNNVQIVKTIVINKSPQEIFRFWRNFENLPRFMNHLQAVTVLDSNHSHWIAKAPAGSTVEWDAVIHNEIDGELIAWRTVGNSDVSHAGSVEFKSAGTAGTEVKVILDYQPPVGNLGAFVAKVFGEEPGQQIDEDLNRFKDLMEGRSVEKKEGGSKKDSKLFENFLK